MTTPDQTATATASGSGSAGHRRRPGLVIGIAVAGLMLSVAATMAFVAFRPPLGAPEAVVVAAGITSVPLLLAVWWATRTMPARDRADRLGFAGSARVLPLLVGVLVGAAARALVEVAAPTAGTHGSLGSPVLVAVILLSACVVAPLVEETFFRGLLLRAIQTVFAPVGAGASALLALLLSTTGFVALHAVAWGGRAPVGSIIAVVVLGVTCGLLVLTLDSTPAAIVAHAVFNGAGLVLAAL